MLKGNHTKIANYEASRAPAFCQITWNIIFDLFSTGMDRETFFHRVGRRGEGQGRGLNLRGWEGLGWGTYCVYQVIEIICYSKGNLKSLCIQLGKPNMFNIHNSNFIHNELHYHNYT